MSAITEVDNQQRRQALALSETGDIFDGDAADPEAFGGPQASVALSETPRSHPVGTGLIAELGQRRVDTMGCPHAIAVISCIGARRALRRAIVAKPAGECSTR